jgi:hypothetical protein
MRPRNCDSVVLSVRDFTVIRESKTLVCEASELQIIPGPFISSAHVVYEDYDIDRGFAILGEDGTKTWFVFRQTETDGEEVVTGWRFLPIPEHVAERSCLRGWSLLVIND